MNLDDELIVNDVFNCWNLGIVNYTKEVLSKILVNGLSLVCLILFFSSIPGSILSWGVTISLPIKLWSNYKLGSLISY